MATTKIDYKNGKGFWINEAFMQLAINYIYQEIQKPQYIFTNKQDLIEDLLDDLNGHTKGYLVLMWHEYLQNQSDEQSMIQVLQGVKIILQNKGAFITLLELKSISTEDKDFKLFYSRKPFPTSELIKIINALTQILQGTWNSTNFDMKIEYQY